jgi:hypothetical protein
VYEGKEKLERQKDPRIRTFPNTGVKANIQLINYGKQDYKGFPRKHFPFRGMVCSCG